MSDMGMLGKLLGMLFELRGVMQSFSQGFHDQTDQCIRNGIAATVS
jgi:hypothetical protein